MSIVIGQMAKDRRFSHLTTIINKCFIDATKLVICDCRDIPLFAHQA